jgi:hypothetical protein
MERLLSLLDNMSMYDEQDNEFDSIEDLLNVPPPVDRKDIKDKPNPLLMPYEALAAYSKVSDYGCKKYGNRDSWKHSATGVETYANAAARHLFKAQLEDLDPESGISHYAHALWSLAAVLYHEGNPLK